MKKINADFLRQEITRLGALVVETGIYHPSGQKLHGTGDALTLAHAKMLREAFLTDLYLAEFDEDIVTARKALGVQRVLPAQVVEGDVLVEDIRNLKEELLVAAGKPLVAEDLAQVHAANLLAVTIRSRELGALTEKAERYLSQLSEQERGLRETLARGTRIIQGTGVTIRYPLIPRAKVLVAVSDDLLRTFLANAALSAGHEVVEHPSATKLAPLLEQERPHVVFLDLEESPGAISEVRQATASRNITVVVCAPEGKTALVHKALTAGANDSLPRPPSRDALQEKIQGCQGLLGRRVLLPPSLRSERRGQARRTVKMVCTLKDPQLPTPLPVVKAEIVDRDDTGFRIEYNWPVWPHRWAYTAQAVHPRHYFYAYAASNPLGRDLLLGIPGGTPSEIPVRVVHLAISGMPPEEIEVMGLVMAGAKPKTPAPSPTTTRRKF